MSVHRATVLSLLGAIRLRSHDAYSWLGQTFAGVGISVETPAGEPSWLARKVHARLYGDFYLTGGPAPASAPLSWRLDLARGATTEALSAANAGRGAAEPGWTVVGVDPPEIVVARDGLSIRARVSQIIDIGSGTAPGAPVALVIPNERRGASEGFYTLLGDAGDASTAAALDRLYWHLRPAGGPLLVEAVSDLMNREGIGFRMKTVNDSRAFQRCDTAVLYTDREDRAATLAVARLLRERVGAHMKAAVPALTHRLAPGLAFAEDPGHGESFGSHRCRLISEALVGAWRAGDLSEHRRLRAIDERFGAEGLDLDRPYLGPGAAGDPPPAMIAP